MSFERGSEWRKWDLHVHTLYSYLKKQFETDFGLENMRVVFKDSVVKTNALLILKQHGINEVVRV